MKFSSLVLNEICMFQYVTDGEVSHGCEEKWVSHNNIFEMLCVRDFVKMNNLKCSIEILMY